MPIPAHIRSSPAFVLGLLLAASRCFGLVSIDDGKNQLFVHATATYAWDSNIFASAAGGGDSIFSASVGLDFQRHAGIIGVNGSVNFDASRFTQNPGENFQNPRFHTEFTKETGRTTGSLTLDAARESRADSAANLRTESWLYNAGLNLKYPVIERYTISGGFGYSLRDYLDNRVLVDLATYSANADLFYVLNTERDLIAGYRLRYSETSSNSSYYDHAFTVGLSGKILPKLGGTVRAGYQLRKPSNPADPDYQALTFSGSATWSLSKRFNSTVTVSKDFSTTATNISIDTTAVNLDSQYVLNSKVHLFTGVGYGINRFLGTEGLGRRDQYFSGNLGGSVTLTPHLKLELTYAYFQNWSNAAFSDFVRNSVTLSATSQF